MLLKMAVLATSNRHEIPPSWYSPEPTSRAKNILLQTVPEWNGCTLNCVFDILLESFSSYEREDFHRQSPKYSFHPMVSDRERGSIALDK
jgi:hypothetical protein